MAEAPAVLALGAWLKNTACRLGGDAGATPQWSAVHGDLSDPAACEALQAAAAALLGGRRPAALAHDLHPDFFSTRLAQRLAAEHGVPAIGVQHHVAHIAAVLAEHGVDEPVLGLALDGFGLGDDGQAWGGELLALDGARWQRVGHLWPLALAGGDAAAREPWRMAAAALHALDRGSEIEPRFTPLVGATTARGVAQMLARGLNCPPSSSAGRWFDAAADALGLTGRRQAHEAEAAIALERCARNEWAVAERQPRVAAPVTPDGVLDLRPLLVPLLDAAADSPELAAACFHLDLADALADWAATAAAARALRTVCLGGGCFANGLLTPRVVQRLQQRGLRVLQPQRVACGDAGLALGQAWFAVRHLRAAAADLSTPSAAESAPCASPSLPA